MVDRWVCDSSLIHFASGEDRPCRALILEIDEDGGIMMLCHAWIYDADMYEDAEFAKMKVERAQGVG
jgi:hypothetical protein